MPILADIKKTMIMQTWFECKVKHVKVSESGAEQLVTESFLIDAVSYTDAESSITKRMFEIAKGGNFAIVSISKSQISEVFKYENGQWWFKAAISMVTIDENAGKEKKIKVFYLVMADDIHEALVRIDESLSFMVIPYTVSSVALSAIVDVFEYEN
jgi:hypothetical protein